MSAVVYRFLDKDGALLYVGATSSLYARLNDHRRTQPWWSEVADVDVERFESRQAAMAAEKEAIQTERPKHNRTLVPPFLGREEEMEERLMHARTKHEAAKRAVRQAMSRPFDQMSAEEIAPIYALSLDVDASGVEYRRAIVGSLLTFGTAEQVAELLGISRARVGQIAATK